MSDRPTSTAELRAELERWAPILREVADTGPDLGRIALVLGALETGRSDIDWYLDHLSELAEAVGLAETQIAAAPADGLPPVPVARAVAALSEILCQRHGYRGDESDYDAPDNANLIRVIDRRLGLPVALGILWCAVARAQGWGAVGLNFPAHFLIRLEVGGERRIVDPFFGGIVRGPEDLRDLIKSIGGAGEELSPDRYAPVPDRAMVLRLMNNTRQRALQGEAFARALAVSDLMLTLAPDEAMLWRDHAVLHARQGEIAAAIAAAERVLALPAPPTLHRETGALLAHLRSQLN